MSHYISTFESFLNENEDEDGEFLSEAAKRRETAIVMKEQEMSLVKQINRYTEMMKSNPAKANYYKLMVDLANAKLQVLAIRNKLETMKGSF
jgi:hypothetical protein